MQPYHKYIFDEKERRFVGRFEEMYRAEQGGGYDSWYQENLTHLAKQLSLVMLNQYNYGSILDIGCGKGAFTHLLKKNNNDVIGIDLSETAIDVAMSKYPQIEWVAGSAVSMLTETDHKFDLIVAMEVLSYIETWREVLAASAMGGQRIFISLYLPDEPIGFVKTFADLLDSVNQHFDIENKLQVNDETLLILAKSQS